MAPLLMEFPPSLVEVHRRLLQPVAQVLFCFRLCPPLLLFGRVVRFLPRSITYVAAFVAAFCVEWVSFREGFVARK